MTTATVVLLAARRPDPDALAAAVRDAHSAGHRVLLVTLRPPAEDAASGPRPDEVHDLTAAASGHGPWFRRLLRNTPLRDRFELHLRHDAWLERHLVQNRDEVAQVVCLDDAAGPGTRWLNVVLFRSRGRHVRDVLLGSVRTVLAAVPSPGRRPARALAAVRTANAAGQYIRAADLARRAAAATDDLRARADLLGEAASCALVHGDGTLLAETAAAELAVADDHLARGEITQATTSFGEALRTAFTPQVHFNTLASPLAADPDGFTAAFTSSATARAVRAPAAPERVRPAGPADRPLRLLFAVRGTESFAAPIRAHLEQRADFETRYLSVPRLPGLGRFVDSPAEFAEQVLTGGTALTEGVSALLGEQLAWADVVFVEWCSQLAALVTRLDPGETRVVVRCHAYEPFTRWPQLVDFSRVDDVVFVSEHLRQFTLAATPGLRESPHTRVHVLPNAADLQRLVRPKPDEARFNLALVGASKIVKDPRWAVEVLRLLRSEDPRYRLHLIGGRFQGEASAVQTYAAALAADVAELQAQGALVQTAFTDDVPGVLEQIGVILSTSVRESFHLGLVEGAASGAVPVVRDWPFFPGAAAELFGADWVVDTPREAADQVLALTRDLRCWREAGAAASERVLSRWDWSVVHRGYEELLGGSTPELTR